MLQRASHAIRQFARLDSASGILLIFAATLAMLAANSPLQSLYDGLLHVEGSIRVGALHLEKPLLLWVNDGWMSVFFCLVGLEIKREVMVGQLTDRAAIALPGIAAAGGMIVPALIYAWLNWHDPSRLSGWAIPAATDIAFALGVLSLFGNRVPTGLKLFLMALAILDDLGAIVVIAVFYTSTLSMLSLGCAAIALTALILLNRFKVMALVPYLIVGAFLWVCVLKSGVHATLAGVAIAMAIPIGNSHRPEQSPVLTLEHALQPWVAFLILPMFAFANAGVSLQRIDADAVWSSVPLGIAAGLFIGKQSGVFVFAWLAVKLRLARLPNLVKWPQIYGVSILCGIGFTMSFFILSLAFGSGDGAPAAVDRLGILAGSLLSATVGYAVLHRALPRKL